MNVRNWRWIGLVVLIAVTACVMTYADKGEGKKMTLPAVVKSAIQAAYPQAVIEKTKMEKEFKVYEVSLKQNGQESEVTITPDGTIIAVETKVAMEKIPAAVAEKLNGADEGAKVKEIDQKITYAVIKVVKLDAPETGYEAELTKDGKECEIKVAANGTVLEKSEWQKAEGQDEHKQGDDEDENEGEHDKDKNEQKVTIDQVPAAVKATILKEVGKGTIKEIEQETKDGQTIYGADIIIDGNKVEIKVSSDGKLLGKQAGDEDKDEDDDNNGGDNDK